MQTFILELPNGQKYQIEKLDSSKVYKDSLDIRRYVTEQYKRKYNEWLEIPVKVYRADIVKMELKLTHIKTLQVEPFESPMTSEEYALEMDILLQDIPKEFHDYVRAQAYDRGHSSGYQEVYNIAVDIMYSLKAPIKEYTDRIAPKT